MKKKYTVFQATSNKNMGIFKGSDSKTKVIKENFGEGFMASSDPKTYILSSISWNSLLKGFEELKDFTATFKFNK